MGKEEMARSCPSAARKGNYDFTTANCPEVACTAILQRVSHSVALRFTEPEEALIRIRGRRVGLETPLAGVPTIIERRVRVQ